MLFFSLFLTICLLKAKIQGRFDSSPPYIRPLAMRAKSRTLEESEVGAKPPDKESQAGL